MQIQHVIQGTDEWLQLRIGKITGTRLKSVMGTPRVQETLIYELIAEELSGQQEKIFVNDAMKWGVEHEDEAVQKYEAHHNIETTMVGFCQHDDYDFVGLSPDRFITHDNEFKGAVEVKCPGTKTFVKYVVAGGVPDDYYWQVIHYFFVNEMLEYLDFVVYDPRVKNPLFIHRVTREDVQDDVEAVYNQMDAFRNTWLDMKETISKKLV